MKWLLAPTVVFLLATSATAFPQLPATATSTVRLKAAVDALSIESEAECLKAIQEIQSLGPWGRPAVPALTKLLLESSPQVAAAVADTFARLGTAAKETGPALVEVIRRPNLDTWLLRSCARAIAAVGKPGQPDMIRATLLTDSDGGRKVGSPIGELILQYPVEMIPVVADHLNDVNPRVRDRAAMNLYRAIRPNSDGKSPNIDAMSAEVRRHVVSQLREQLNTAQPRVRDWIVPAIIDLDPTTMREAIPVYVTLIRKHEGYGAAEESLARHGPEAARLLVDYLDDPNPDVRLGLAGTIAKCRGNMRPFLSSALRHDNPAIRIGVLKAISLNHSHAQGLRGAIINRLGDDNFQVRLSTATTLVSLDPTKATTALPVLTEAIFSRKDEDRLRAIVTLQAMGPHAKSAVIPLCRQAHSGDLDTRFAAAQALARIDRSTWPTYVPVLIDTIAFGEIYQRNTAARLLGEAGPNARQALPALRGILSDEHFNNRIVSAEALIQIAPENTDAPMKCFNEALAFESGNERITRNHRRQAIAALVRIGPKAKATVPALLEVMRQEPNEHYAMLAATAAIKIDPDKSDEAYDRFRQYLQPSHPDPDDSWLDGIAQLGKAAKPLLPDLIAALQGKTNIQRVAAIEALAAIGPDAKEALPALRQMVKAGKHSANADEAIKAIEGKK